MRTAACIVTLSLSLASSAAAQAPGPPPAQRARARDAFERGLQAASEGSWEQARDAFQEAYDIVPRPLLLLNLAGALVHTGQLNEAASAYERFLSRADPDEHASYIPKARQALDEVRRRIPTVRVWVEGLAHDDRIVLDGERASSRSPLVTTVDPGAHRVSVTRGERQLASERFDAPEGEVVELRLSVPAPSTEAQPAPAQPAEPDTQPAPLAPMPGDGTDEPSAVWRSPWLWAGVGVAVAAVVTTALAVGLGGGGGSQPFRGSLEPSVLEVP